MRLFAFIKSIVFLFFGLLFLFICLLTIVCALPSRRINDNIAASVGLLEAEGDFPELGGRGDVYKLDNFSDSLMLNILYNVNRRTPLKSALLAKDYYHEDPGTRELKRLVESQGGKEPNRVTGRYWLGWMVIVRPLLLITQYSGIRTLMSISFALLCGALSILLYRRLGLFIALSFPLSLALVNFQTIPYSMELSITFSVAFVGMSVLLLLPPMDLASSARFYFLLGACTIFIDFLTTPLLAFGLPAIVSILLQGRDFLTASLRNAAKQVLTIGIAWLAGYTALFLSKWAVASMILGRSVFQEAGERIVAHTAAIDPNLDNGNPLRLSAIISNAAIVLRTGANVEQTYVYLFLGVCAVALACWWSRASVQSLQLQLASVAGLPYVWYALVPEHSVVHAFYTFRIQVVTIMALMCIFFYAARPWRFRGLDLVKAITKLQSRLRPT